MEDVVKTARGMYEAESTKLESIVEGLESGGMRRRRGTSLQVTGPERRGIVEIEEGEAYVVCTADLGGSEQI